MADVLTILGLVAICTGVAVWSWPAACVTGGAIVLLFGVMAAERERRKVKP